jgi:hypothetical protein
MSNRDLAWQRRWRQALAWLLALVGSGACGPLACHAQTWAERLGYPADKKVVILHAHGAGLAYETNAAVEALLDGGLKLSYSVAAPCPWFADCVSQANQRGDVDCGLSLTLNSEEATYRWQPVAAEDRVRSLVDDQGFLWSTPMQTMVSADAADVDAELRAQIERSLKLGRRPTHFTTHLGTLFARLDLVETYFRAAREYWIPAVVVELTPEGIERFRRLGFPLDPAMIDLIQSYPLPKLDDLRRAPEAPTYEAKRAAFLQMLEELPPGLTQIVLMPAVESPALMRITPDWRQRTWDLQLLQDPEVRAVLTSEPVVLTTWREVMSRYEGTRGPVQDAQPDPAASDTP